MRTRLNSYALYVYLFSIYRLGPSFGVNVTAGGFGLGLTALAGINLVITVGGGLAAEVVSRLFGSGRSCAAICASVPVLKLVVSPSAGVGVRLKRNRLGVGVSAVTGVGHRTGLGTGSSLGFNSGVGMLVIGIRNGLGCVASCCGTFYKLSAVVVGVRNTLVPSVCFCCAVRTALTIVPMVILIKAAGYVVVSLNVDLALARRAGLPVICAVRCVFCTGGMLFELDFLLGGSVANGTSTCCNTERNTGGINGYNRVAENMLADLVFSSASLGTSVPVSLCIVSVVTVGIEYVVTFTGSAVTVIAIVFVFVTSGHTESNCQSHNQKE